MKPYIINAEELESLENIPAVVIGNGPSRLQYDIAALKGRCIVFGCNRFFEDAETFKGFPFMFGACDDTVYRAVDRRKEILEYFPLLVPENAHPLSERLSRIINFKERKWLNTGHAMIQFAFDLKCSPVFIVGFGDQPLKIVEGAYLENVYKHDSFEKGQRISPTPSYSNNVNRFVNTLKILKTKNPRSLFRIGDHSGALRFIEVVEYKELIDALPFKYSQKVTRIDEARATIKIQTIN